MTIKTKLILSLSAIAVVLLVSSVISVMEYRGMSSYVSDRIADNIHSINVAQTLADETNAYNLEILSVIGDEAKVNLPDYDADKFAARCDSLRSSLATKAILPLADSVEYSYSAFILTSFELMDVLKSDFIDSRTWYFERLQPRYNRLRADIYALNGAIYDELAQNSGDFESGFYRSIIPGIVAVGVGLLLVLMLLFFMLGFYVNPLYRMLSHLKSYRSNNKRYSLEFEGDDQLHELNESISEIANENLQLRKRISLMKSEKK